MFEQTFLLAIIFGRWLLPKGSLSRDKLSSLLLLFIGKACDISDFFTLINETTVRSDNALVYCILIAWSISVVQLSFALTETYVNDNKKKSDKPFDKMKIVFLGTDVWCCVISIFMEELPFLVIRAYTIATHNLTSFSVLFFITKNCLLLLMLIYRIISVLSETICKNSSVLDIPKNDDFLADDNDVITESELISICSTHSFISKCDENKEPNNTNDRNSTTNNVSSKNKKNGPDNYPSPIPLPGSF